MTQAYLHALDLALLLDVRYFDHRIHAHRAAQNCAGQHGAVALDGEAVVDGEVQRGRGVASRELHRIPQKSDETVDADGLVVLMLMLSFFVLIACLGPVLVLRASLVGLAILSLVCDCSDTLSAHRSGSAHDRCVLELGVQIEEMEVLLLVRCCVVYDREYVWWMIEQEHSFLMD